MTLLEISQRLDASVVRIGRDGRGTGFVLADGRVVTNSHHLRDVTTQVELAGGRITQARVTGHDLDGDLVVLELDTAGAAPVSFAEAAPTLGDEIVALGRAGSGLRVTTGRISAVGQSFRGPRGRLVEGAFEHTAPLPRGASGGPVVDTSGAVVGITTLRLPGGFALARPTDDALRARLDQLADGVSTERRTIGVTVAPSHVANRLRRSVGLPERDGLLVREVLDSSPAAAGGMLRGDLIVAVAGTPVSTPEALAAAIEAADASVPLVVTVVRGAEELELSLSLAMPEDGPSDR